MTETVAEEFKTQSRSLFQLAFIRFRRNAPAMIACLILALITLFSFFGPLFTSHRYDQLFGSYLTIPPSLEPRPDEAALRDAMERVATGAGVRVDSFVVNGGTFMATVSADSPINPGVPRYVDRADEFRDTKAVSIENAGRLLRLTGLSNREYFPFGTDSSGRDLLVRVMLGGQVSIAAGLLASLVALGIGVSYGAVSGYLGGLVDNVMMRCVEILYSLPFIFLVIALVVFFGRNFLLIFLVIGAVEWLDIARIARGQALALKRREFVGAAQALGLTDWQIVRRHIIPNMLGPIVVFVTIIVPKVILLESFLSFLGLGVQAPLTSWGVLISEGANNIQSAPWLLAFPSIFFVATLFSLNVIGDGLRDALDPKDR